MPALPTIQKSSSPATGLSREALRARAVEKVAELMAKKSQPAPEPAVPAAEEEKVAQPEAKIPPGSPVGDDKERPRAPEPAKEPAEDTVPSPAEEKKSDPPKPERPTSDAMLAFARQQAALKAQEDALKKRAAEIETKTKEFAADEALKKQDRYAWAEKHGLSLKGWNERALNDGNKTPEEIAEEIAGKKIAELEKRWEDRQAEQRQAEEQREAAAAMQRWDAQLDALVAAPADGKPGDFALARSKLGELLGWKSLTKQVIFAQREENKRALIAKGIDPEIADRQIDTLTNKQAADRVEAFLGQIREAVRELDKATFPAAQSPAQQQAPKVTQGGTVQSPRTLDPDSPASPPPNLDEEANLSSEERKALRRKRALAKLG